MYLCNQCGYVFQTPMVLSSWCSDKYGSDEIDGCPECSDESFTEVEQCSCCEEYFPEDELVLFENGSYLCGECLNENYINENDKVVIGMTTALKIKRKREEKQMTQTELANKAGVTSQMICQIEKGSKNPSFQVAKLIAEALDCTLDELAG